MSVNPTTSVFEYATHASEASKDVLYLERLDTFMEKCLGDIKAFAERELRPYEETRRSVAQWHAKYLFQPSATSTTFHDSETSASNRVAQVRATLCDTSRILESLSDTSGVQAFILAVDPNDLADGGFLGGSLIGREFWRQMRGGGDHGARAFKTHCASRLSNTSIIGVQVNHEKQDRISTPPPKAGPARSIKNELYDSVRNALRLASGIRGAEMKWTNPEKLDLYGVRLVGWPEGVPAQNPSTLKVNQNKLLLEAIQNGTLKFEKLNNVGATGGCQDPSRLGSNEVNEDFSWAYDADACPSSPPFSRTAASSLHKVVNQEPVSSNNIPRPGNETDTWSLDPNLEDNTTFSPYNVDYTWIGEFSEQMAGPSRGHSDSQLNAERPHKRQRSEEPYPVKEL